MKKYYYSDGNEQFGPYSLEELKKKNITKNTLIWSESMDDWKPASDVQELNVLFAPMHQGTNANTNSYGKDKLIIALLLVAVISGFAGYFLNSFSTSSIETDPSQFESASTDSFNIDSEENNQNEGNTNKYSFDKLIPLALGPEVVNENEPFMVDLFLAGYNSDENLVVTFEGPETVNVRPGRASITTSLNSSQELKGTISLKDASGVSKAYPWSKNITVMRPTGSIELPELNVLYRGYNNVVNITASGYPSEGISVTNGSTSKTGSGYIVKPGKGNTTAISVIGKDINGNSVSLKSIDYRVEDLPDPILFWGGSKSGDKGNKSSTIIEAKYGPEIPLNANFKILSWKFFAPGLKGAAPTGAGSNISSVYSLIRGALPGTGIGFLCKVRGPDGKVRNIAGFWSL